MIGRFLGDGWVLDGRRKGKGRKNSFVYKVVICSAFDEKEECLKIIKDAGYNPTIVQERTIYKFIICNKWLCEFCKKFGRYAAYKKLAPRLVTYLPYAEKLEELKKLKEDVSKVKEYLEFRKQIEDEYIKSYYDTRLKDLDVKELLYILKEKFGYNIILLCHEKVDEFCHRRLDADYIELETGIYIPEVSVDEKGNVKKLVPIRYKNRLKEAINKR